MGGGRSFASQTVPPMNLRVGRLKAPLPDYECRVLDITDAQAHVP